MNEKPSLLHVSIKDFFTKEILKLASFPFIITMVVMYSLFFIVADIGLDQLSNAQLQVQQSETTLNPDGTSHTEEINQFFSGSSVMTFLLQYSFVSWLVSFLVYTVGSFLVMYLSVAIGLFVIGFLTPWILPIIRDRHYPDLKIEGFGTIPEVLWFFVKTLFIMIALMFLLIPFYFIPLLNIVAINLPFYYFFHRLLNFDVGSTICKKEDYKKIMFYKGNSIRFKTFVMFLVTMIPFTAIFIMVFFVVYLGHVYFNELQNLQKEALSETPTAAS
ncbi:MAG: EI24 domain-containing protein [Campylobacterota bacterium]|nr:EI24 domain-containing protein [Campylobacterota bacterium]